MKTSFRRLQVAIALTAVLSTEACIGDGGSGGRPLPNVAARRSAESQLPKGAAPSPVLATSMPTCDAEATTCEASRARYTFRDVARQTRTSSVVPRDTWGALWADYDGNGYPDLFIGRHEGPPDFLSNDHGIFSRLPVDFVRPPGYDTRDGDKRVDRHSCAWGEADGDGRLDLYCAVGANRGMGLGPNQLLVQRDSGFNDVAHGLDVADPSGRGKSVNWMDYDGDGDLDLFVGNARRFDRPAPNAVFERAEKGFVRSRAGLEDQLVTMSSSWADWDVDGDPDLLVLQYPSSGQPAVAYENVGGSYRRTTLPHATGKRWHAACWGDYNGDGRTDLAMVSIHHLMILENSKRGLKPVFETELKKGQMCLWFEADNDGDMDLFVVQGAPPPMPSKGANLRDFLVLREGQRFRRVNLASVRGPRDGCGDSGAAADFDRDGRVDLFITNGAEGRCRGRDVLLRNLSTGGHSVALELLGDPENPLGMGSRIHVQAGSLSYWRELTDGVNFRSQSEVGHQVLGIGSARAADVKVIWPDQTSDCVRITAGGTKTVTKGSSVCFPYRSPFQ
jgi:FG-GAP-like repeat